MCNLFKNTLNDTPFFRKLHMEERNRGSLNTGVCVLGAWSALSLQALSSPHTWCCLGVPSETALPPPTAPPQLGRCPLFAAGGHTYMCCHHYKRGELLGAEDTRSHHHHDHHQCITPTAEDWPPILLTSLSLVMSSSPSFWNDSHATVCCSPLFLLWKYQFYFVTQLPQSSYGHSAASGCQWVHFPLARSCKGRQLLLVPREDVLFVKRWCDHQEWNCSPQSPWDLWKTKCERRNY